MIEYNICMSDKDEPILIEDECLGCLNNNTCTNCIDMECYFCKKKVECLFLSTLKFDTEIKARYIKERKARQHEYKKIRHLINNPKERRKKNARRQTRST